MNVLEEKGSLGEISSVLTPYLHLFNAASAVFQKYGLVLIKKFDTIPTYTLGISKMLDLTKLGEYNPMDLVSQISYEESQIESTAKLRTMCYSTKIPSHDYDHALGRHNLPAYIQDDNCEYELVKLPMHDIQNAMFNELRHLFGLQYVTPVRLLETVRSILPPTLCIANSTCMDYHNYIDGRYRCANIIYGSKNHNLIYLLKGVVTECQMTIEKIIDFTLELRSQLAMTTRLVQMVNLSNVTHRENDDILKHVSSTPIPEFCVTLFKVLINPNVYKVSLEVSCTTLEKSFFKLLSILINMRLLPPCVVTIENRIRINNMFAHFICQHVLHLTQTSIEHLNAAGRLPNHAYLPATSTSSEWSTTDHDYLPTLFLLMPHFSQNQNGMNIATTTRDLLFHFFHVYFSGQLEFLEELQNF